MQGFTAWLVPALAAATCISSVFAGPAPQQSNDAPAAPTESAPEYTILQQRPDRLVVTLPNRMIIIAQEMPTAPVVSVQTWIKTGSIYEQEHVGAGLSHFLEHLLAGGTTTTRTEEETNAILGRIGAQTNAATSLDTVRYYINTTSDNTATAIDLLSDWMRNSTIGEAEFQRERDVIQREFSMGEGEPGRIFWKLTQQARYTAHPARHPTIGYLDEFLKISRDQIYDFYKRMYAPNNLVFVVAGDIDKQAVVEQVASLWADAQPRELPELSFPAEPEIDQPRTLTGKADIKQPRLRLAWPGTRLAEEGDYALDLLAMVLGQGETSRLVREVRDQQRLANDIGSYNVSFPWGEGYFAVEAEIAQFPLENEDPEATPEQQAQQRLGVLKQAVLRAVEQLRDEPVTDRELARAKRNVLADVLSASQTADGVASRLASDLIGQGDPDYLPKYADAIQKLTAEDLQQAAQRFLTENRLITVQLLPRGEEAPERLARPEEAPQDLPVEPIDIDNALVVEQVRENVAATDAPEQVVQVDEPVTYTLENGLRLIVQRSTLVPSASMQLYWKGGLLGEPADKAGIANAMAAMLPRGTESRSAQEIAEAVEDLGASLGTQGGNNTTYAQARALKEDWPSVMGLLAEVVRQPSFPAEEWARMQPRLLAAIDRQRDSWYGELSAEFREDYYAQHPWGNTPLGEKDVIANLTVEDLRKFHADQLVGPNMVIAVVGDVEPEQVREQVEQLFGDIPGTLSGEFAPQAPVPPVARIEQAPTRKPVAAVTIGFGPVIERSHPDYPALQVLSRLFSNFPAGWLDRALRGEGPGLVYASWAHLVTGLVPGHFAITFNTTPATVDETLSRAIAVAERARTGEISEEDLQRAKAKVLTTEFFGRQSNSERAMDAALDELYGVGDLGGRKFAQSVQALTADDIRAAARKYLQNPVVTVLTNEPVPAEALEQAVYGAPEPDVETDSEAEPVAADGEDAASDEDPEAEPATATQ